MTPIGIPVCVCYVGILLCTARMTLYTSGMTFTPGKCEPHFMKEYEKRKVKKGEKVELRAKAHF